MNFRAIEASRRPNRWLVCPPGYASIPPDEEPPVFAVPVDALRARWKALIAAVPRIEIVSDEADGMDLVQRTPVLRFADDIGVAYVGLGQSRSTIALFSRSRLGYSDFGANRRRLRAWVGALREAVPIVRAGS